MNADTAWHSPEPSCLNGSSAASPRLCPATSAPMGHWRRSQKPPPPSERSFHWDYRHEYRLHDPAAVLEYPRVLSRLPPEAGSFGRRYSRGSCKERMEFLMAWPLSPATGQTGWAVEQNPVHTARRTNRSGPP